MRFAIWLCLLLGIAFPALAAPAVPTGTVTMVEGKGHLIRGVNRYLLAEGVRVDKGDIIELADKAFAEIEFADGAAIALGSQSRLLLVPASAKNSGSEPFLLQGQIKTTTRSSVSRLSTPIVAVSAVNSTVVLQSDNAGAALFLERGEGKLQELSSGKAVGNLVVVKSGEFYSRKAEQKHEILPRPPGAFVSALPRAFLDNLPSRLAKFKDIKVEPKKTEDFSYADVEAWLKSTAAVRKIVVARWQTKARDPAFRKELVANLKDHPEWDRILYPEKYDEAAKKAKEATSKAKASQY